MIRRTRRHLGIGLSALLVLAGASFLAARPVAVHAAVNLSLTQTTQGAAVVGQNLTFVVTMTNLDTNPVFEGIDDQAPTNVNVISVQGSGITCARNHGFDVLCQPTTIAAGASVMLSLTVRPTAAGPVTNTASADPSFLYFSQLTVNAAPAPTDVQVTGSASTGSPPAGSQFSYTFQVKDNGPFGVGDVTFSDPLPAQVQFVSATASNGSACTLAAGSVGCDLGSLITGGQVNVVITVVAPTTPGTFTNTASVAIDVTDTQPANNSVGVTVQVK